MPTLPATGSPPRRVARVSRSSAVLGASAVLVAVWLGSTAPTTSPVTGPGLVLGPAAAAAAAAAPAPVAPGADTVNDGQVLDRGPGRRDGRR